MFVGLVPRVSGWCATPYMPWPWKQQEAGSIPSEKALGWRVARRLAAQRAAAAAPAAAAGQRLPVAHSTSPTSAPLWKACVKRDARDLLAPNDAAASKPARLRTHCPRHHHTTNRLLQ